MQSREKRLRSFLIMLGTSFAVATLIGGELAAKAQMTTGKSMTDFAKVFGLQNNPSGDLYRAELVKSTIPGNILWPGESLTMSLKIQNRQNAPLDAAGKLSIVA